METILFYIEKWVGKKGETIRVDITSIIPNKNSKNYAAKSYNAAVKWMQENRSNDERAKKLWKAWALNRIEFYA